MRARDVFWNFWMFILVWITYVCYFYIHICLFVSLFVCLFVAVFLGRWEQFDFSYTTCEELVAKTWAIVDSELWGFPLWERCVVQTWKNTPEVNPYPDVIAIIWYIYTFVLLGISALFWGVDFKTRGHEGALGIWLPFSCINFRMNYYIDRFPRWVNRPIVTPLDFRGRSLRSKKFSADPTWLAASGLGPNVAIIGHSQKSSLIFQFPIYLEPLAPRRAFFYPGNNGDTMVPNVGNWKMRSSEF